MDKIKIKTACQEFEAALADSFAERFTGLSFKSSGKMLFAFSRDTRARIDMMFLSEPLHLYFMNSDKEVIDVQKAEPWGWNPGTWKLYSPGEPYRYLLESFEKLDIEEKERLEFDL